MTARSPVALDLVNLLLGLAVTVGTLWAASATWVDGLPAWASASPFGAFAFTVLVGVALAVGPLVLWRRRHAVRVDRARIEVCLVPFIPLQLWREMRVGGWWERRGVEHLLVIVSDRGDVVELSVTAGIGVTALMAHLRKSHREEHSREQSGE